VSTPSQERVAQVRRRITGAAQSAERRHPGFADTIRSTFDRLRGGLDRAHAQTAPVDGAAWADYVDGLDRGLDELDKEIARAAEQGGDVHDVLVVHATGIELQGWRLQVSLPGVEPKLAAAQTELDRYTAGDGSADALDRAMQDLRGR
jgi:hypothetical protein